METLRGAPPPSVYSSPKTSNPQRPPARVPFQVFEHTADIGLDVEADDLDGLFADAGRGLFSVVRGDNPVAPEKRFHVTATADTLERLLARFLNELVYLMDAEGVVFHEVEDVRVTEQEAAWEVRAEATGEPFSHEKHPGCLHVKAVTRHGARFTEPTHGQPGSARVILDV